MQQNHGEDLIKGYLQWDVAKRKAVFKRVINDFGYYTLDIVKGKHKKYDNMPYKPRLRIRINETKELKFLHTYLHTNSVLQHRMETTL